MRTYIYILIDPITLDIRYVGKSVNPEVRLRRHLSEARCSKKKSHRIHWLKSLLAYNVKPKIEIIDEIEGDWEWLEEYWICQIRAWGFNLVNGTSGGDNPPSWKGKTHSDEYKKIRKKIMTENNPSKKMNDIWRKNISDSHKKNNFIPIKAIEKNKVKVKQFTLNDEFIKVWDSITDAARGVGLSSNSGIAAVCNKKRKKAGGYKWSFII